MAPIPRSHAGPDPIDVEVGLRMKQIRRTRGLTQEAVAKRCGITFQQLQKYERGFNRVSASMLVHLATALGCRVGDLLPDETEGPLGLPPRVLEIIASLRGADDLVSAFSRIDATEEREAILRIAAALAKRFA